MPEPSPNLSRVLLSNDDGIDAPGIQALRHAIQSECELLVVAPLSEQSGAGASLASIRSEMAVVRRIEEDHLWGLAVEGTPVDCIKFALRGPVNYQPDLVLSGINLGRNIGNSVFYSGTVAAALEATMFGVRAMAVSLAARPKNRFYFETAARITRSLLPWLLEQTWKPRTLWNLNVPNLPLEKVKGIRFTHQGTSFYVDEFVLERSAGDIEYYKNVGSHLEMSPEPANSDDIVLEEGYASLSLLSMGLTVEMPPSASEALEREWDRLVFEAGSRTEP